MKTLFRIETNAGWEFATYEDEDNILRIYDGIDAYPENCDENDPDCVNMEISGYDNFKWNVKIEDVEDDSSWERYDDVSSIDEFYNSDNDCKIIEFLDVDF